MTTTGLPITQGTGTASVATELVGGNSFQQIEVYGAGGASTLGISSDGSLKVSVIGALTINPASVSGTVGASIIGTVPMTGFPSNQSVSGAISMAVPISSSTQGITSVITGTTSVLVLPAPASSKTNYITHVLVTNSGAAVTTVSLVDNGKIIWSGNAGASGGGWSENFNVPLGQPTSTLALYAISSVQSSVIVAVNGFTA